MLGKQVSQTKKVNYEIKNEVKKIPDRIQSFSSTGQLIVEQQKFNPLFETMHDEFKKDDIKADKEKLIDHLQQNKKKSSLTAKSFKQAEKEAYLYFKNTLPIRRTPAIIQS